MKIVAATTLILLAVVQIVVWLCGLRPYIHSQGKSCVTASRFGLSILADWSTAWDTGREARRVPLCAKGFLLIMIAEMLAALTVFV